MKRIKQILAALILLTVLTNISCGQTETVVEESSSTETTDAVTTVDELAAPTLPDKDYKGYEFKILTRIEGWGIYNNEHLVIDEENGEILNDAIYNRNRRVEERFNIRFTETVTAGNIATEITKTVMAGDDSYDLVIPTSTPNLGTEHLVDFNTLDYVNLDKPWWNQNYLEANSINGKLCSAVNSVMITHMDSVLAMFYNKKLAADNKLPDLYQIVRDGDWTLDKYFELTKGITTDSNGDGSFNDKDVYAFVGLDGIGRLSSGVELDSVTKNSDDLPQLNFDSPQLIEKLNKLRDYASLYERDIYNPRSDSNTGGDGDKAVFRLFQNDQALFYVHGLGSAQMYRDMVSDFGVIPTPKLDASQENYFITPDMTKCLVIPASASDLERTAIIIEAMAYEGYTYLRPLYYETMLQSKYLRDDESVEMLDEYVYTNIGFSVYCGTNAINTTVNGIISGSGEVASTLASNKTSLQEEISKYIELYK